MLPAMAAAAAAASLFAATLAGPSAGALAAPAATVPPDGVTVDVVAANGSGCPAGTTAVLVSPGGDTVSVVYSAFLAQVGLGAASTEFRRNCQLSLAIHVPPGYRYAVSGVEHRGFAHLEAGASGMQRTRYYSSGQAPSALLTHRFDGPHDDFWTIVDEVDTSSLVFSPCYVERNLNINSDLVVYAGTSDPDTTTSFMTMDTTESDIYRFVWRQCA